jgi:RNase P subunit RPR2
VSAQAELERLIAFGGRLEGQPPWMRDGPGQRAERFLMVGSNIALPVLERRTEWVAVTCVSLGWIKRTRETARAPRAGRGHHNRGRRT